MGDSILDLLRHQYNVLNGKIEKQQAQIDGLLAIIELHGKAHGFMKDIIGLRVSVGSFNAAYRQFNSIVDQLKEGNNERIPQTDQN